ncbi:MAG: XamI family restriction endonuclease, partial [Planctomycetaceae bacterium]|nr:XamI family restriction endonuclease [Planctomycetaceae bacterium]
MNKTDTQKWKEDIAKSVDFYNQWFLEFAPKAYLETRHQTSEKVENAFRLTNDLRDLTAEILRNNPAILPALRMSTCPPLARDRLINLANVSPSLVKSLENGKLPVRKNEAEVTEQLKRILQMISRLLDPTILGWLSERETSPGEARTRAASVIADRLCGSEADPIIRNAQEQRQLTLLENWLLHRRYQKIDRQKYDSITNIPAGFFGIRYSVLVERQAVKPIQIPVDLVVRPFKKQKNKQIVLIE